MSNLEAAETGGVMGYVSKRSSVDRKGEKVAPEQQVTEPQGQVSIELLRPLTSRSVVHVGPRKYVDSVTGRLLELS